jgi:hypothetical protein
MMSDALPLGFAQDRSADIPANLPRKQTRSVERMTRSSEREASIDSDGRRQKQSR